MHTRRAIKLGSLLSVLGLVIIGAAFPGVTGAEPDRGHTPVAICHATASATNPYVFITVDDDAIERQGHSTHQGFRDIIPPGPWLPGGLNWDPAGILMWLNGCVPPAPAPTPTATPTKPPAVLPTATSTPEKPTDKPVQPTATPTETPTAEIAPTIVTPEPSPRPTVIVKPVIPNLPTGETPEPEVLGVAVERDELAQTGIDMALLIVGLTLLAAGLLFVPVTRRLQRS